MRRGCPHLFIFPLNYVIYNKYLYSPKKKKHYQQWRSRLVPKMGRKGYIRTLWFTLKLQKGPLINVVGNIYIIVQWGPAHTLYYCNLHAYNIYHTTLSALSHSPNYFTTIVFKIFISFLFFLEKKLLLDHNDEVWRVQRASKQRPRALTVGFKPTQSPAPEATINLRYNNHKNGSILSILIYLWNYLNLLFGSYKYYVLLWVLCDDGFQMRIKL